MRQSARVRILPTVLLPALFVACGGGGADEDEKESVVPTAVEAQRILEEMKKAQAESSAPAPAEPESEEPVVVFPGE